MSRRDWWSVLAAVVIAVVAIGVGYLTYDRPWFGAVPLLACVAIIFTLGMINRPRDGESWRMPLREPGSRNHLITGGTMVLAGLAGSLLTRTWMPAAILGTVGLITIAWAVQASRRHSRKPPIVSETEAGSERLSPG